MVDGVEGDVVAAVTPARQVWQQVCDAGRPLTELAVPAADSPAMTEIAAESSLSCDRWREPVMAAHAVIRMSLFAVNDHLRSYAHLFETEPIPVFSHLVVARAAVETAGLVSWLADPSCTVEQRVMRYQVYRLVNANAMGYGHAPDGARVKAVEVRTDVREGCQARGWTYRSGKNKSVPTVGTETLPTPRQLIDAVVATAPEVGPFGSLLWWYLSGVTHGQQHALMQSFKVLDGSPVTAIGQPVGAFITESVSVSVTGQTVTDAYVRTTDRVAALFGWYNDDWAAAVAASTEAGRRIADSVARL